MEVRSIESQDDYCVVSWRGCGRKRWRINSKCYPDIGLYGLGR